MLVDMKVFPVPTMLCSMALAFTVAVLCHSVQLQVLIELHLNITL